MKKILVIDDDQNVRKVLSFIFEKAGFNVETESCGELGILTAKSKKFDLIVLDIRMPKMDGIETFKKLKETLGQTCPPIIAMSSSYDGLKKNMDPGFNGFLRKPFTSSELANVTGRFL